MARIKPVMRADWPGMGDPNLKKHLASARVRRSVDWSTKVLRRVTEIRLMSRRLEGDNHARVQVCS